MQKVRTFLGHLPRANVSAQSWNSHLLSTGGADRVILHRDMRVPEHSVTRLQGHASQITGLKVTVYTCNPLLRQQLKYCDIFNFCIHVFAGQDRVLACAMSRFQASLF